MELRNISMAICLLFLKLAHAYECLHKVELEFSATQPIPLEYMVLTHGLETEHLNSHEPSEAYPNALLSEIGENLISMSFLTDEELQTLSEESITRMGQEGIKLLKRASNNDYSPATRILAMCYISGHFIDRDLIEGENYLRIAADKGDCIAQYELALLHIRGDLLHSNPYKAVNYLSLAADQGYPDALFALGTLYEQINSNIPTGIVPQSFPAAAQYYKQAADKGSTNAQLALGKCYLDGRGVQKNEEQAIELMTHAAQNGLPYAYTILGMRYHEGLGVSKNLEKSLEYIKLASDLGDPSAQIALGCFFLLDNQPIKQDRKEGLKWLKFAAKKGDSLAQEALTLLNVFPSEQEEPGLMGR